MSVMGSLGVQMKMSGGRDQMSSRTGQLESHFILENCDGGQEKANRLSVSVSVNNKQMSY